MINCYFSSVRVENPSLLNSSHRISAFSRVENNCYSLLDCLFKKSIMKTGEFVLFALVVYISIIGISAIGRYRKEKPNKRILSLFILADNNEGDYEQLKRYLSGQKHRGTMGRIGSSSSEENSYPSSGICASNPCEHEGICISKGRTSYYCECIDDYYGKNCEKRKIENLSQRLFFFIF